MTFKTITACGLTFSDGHYTWKGANDTLKAAESAAYAGARRRRAEADEYEAYAATLRDATIEEE